MTRRFLGLIAFVALTGCNAAQQSEKQVRAAYAEMDQAMIAKDVQKGMSNYAPDAVVMDAKNKPMSLSALQSGLQMLFSAATSVQSTTTVSSVEAKGQGITASTSSKVTLTNAQGTIESTSTSRDYWEKVNGTWKIKRSRVLSDQTLLNGRPLR